MYCHVSNNNKTSCFHIYFTILQHLHFLLQNVITSVSILLTMITISGHIYQRSDTNCLPNDINSITIGVKSNNGEYKAQLTHAMHPWA